MDKPHLLMNGPLMPMIQEALPNRFTVHRWWEAADREAFLARVAPDVVAIAAANTSPSDDALMARLPKLKLISSFGVGYDAIDAAAAGRRGIIVTNTPDVLTEEVADTALGLLLSTIRELPQADRYLRAGKWLDKPFPLTATLRGKTVGILGYGRIGKAIGTRLEAFGVAIAYHGRNQQPGVRHAYHPTLVGMARAVDILMIVAPGGAATHHMVGAEVLAALGPEGVLINVGRGSVVDEKALIAALKAGTIRSAGLDVFEDEPRVPAELIAMDQVVLFPHVGSGTHHTRRAMAQLVIDNLFAYADGRPPLTPVDETPWAGQW